ncbi:uncharacterized protein IWZ02DRAFT_112387 [Phyllosticta citriasiana]|uniref:uncharacterized protein n=1 Tax=Phyllosticta citriasiana TaxID=595635 RepID=UPI0030FD2358
MVLHHSASTPPLQPPLVQHRKELTASSCGYCTSSSLDPALSSPGHRPDSLQPHGRPVVRNSAARTQSKTRTAYVAYSTRALSNARCGRQLAHLPLIPICPDRRLRNDCLASHPLSIYIRPASGWLFFSLFASRDKQFSLTLQLRLVPSPPLCDLCFQSLLPTISPLAMTLPYIPLRLTAGTCRTSIHAHPCLLEALVKPHRTPISPDDPPSGCPSKRPSSQTTCARHIR